MVPTGYSMELTLFPGARASPRGRRREHDSNSKFPCGYDLVRLIAVVYVVVLVVERRHRSRIVVYFSPFVPLFLAPFWFLTHSYYAHSTVYRFLWEIAWESRLFRQRFVRVGTRAALTLLLAFAITGGVLSMWRNRSRASCTCWLGSMHVSAWEKAKTGQCASLSKDGRR
jgi:hypothetical protein